MIWCFFLPTSIIQSHQYSPSTLFYEMRENELLMKLIIDAPAHRPLYWWLYLHGTFIPHRKCRKSLLFKINEKAGIIMSINVYMRVNHKRLLYFWVYVMWFAFLNDLLRWKLVNSQEMLWTNSNLEFFCGMFEVQILNLFKEEISS